MQWVISAAEKPRLVSEWCFVRFNEMQPAALVCTVTCWVSFPLWCSLYIRPKIHTGEKKQELAEMPRRRKSSSIANALESWDISPAIRLYWSCEYLAGCQLEGGKKKKTHTHRQQHRARTAASFSNRVKLKWASYWRKCSLIKTFRKVAHLIFEHKFGVFFFFLCITAAEPAVRDTFWRFWV